MVSSVGPIGGNDRSSPYNSGGRISYSDQISKSLFVGEHTLNMLAGANALNGANTLARTPTLFFWGGGGGADKPHWLS